MGATPPYRTMAEDTEKPDTEKPDTDGGGRERSTFHIATLACDDLVVYI